jgi:hypothetical protein
MTIPSEDEPTNMEAPSEVSRTGAQLDEHHAAQTNGRMAVCQRCGMATDGPAGRHAPHEKQLEKAARWLDAQALSSRIATMTSARNT